MWYRWNAYKIFEVNRFENGHLGSREGEDKYSNKPKGNLLWEYEKDETRSGLFPPASFGKVSNDSTISITGYLMYSQRR